MVSLGYADRFKQKVQRKKLYSLYIPYDLFGASTNIAETERG